MRAIVVTEFGGPEVLVATDVPEPQPAPGQLLVSVDRAGVNYADTHQAENSYLSRTVLPMVPGGEVVGSTPDGRRLVAMVAGGGYAERAVVDPVSAFDVPEAVDDVTALAMVVQGLTAWLLLRRSVHLEPGETVVVHAAAGGVGSLAVQLAKAWGAGRVIATASSPEKRELALSLGADAAVEADAPDMTAALREANEGRRVEVVLDMTGGQVTDQSLVALAPFGRLAFYGMANRQAPKPVAPASLLAHSTTVAGMWLPHAYRTPGLVRRAMTELFDLVAKGSLRAVAGGEYPLSQARLAHEDLRARRTTGKLVLDPSR
ncbi:MAG TPA: NADPH:quinone oxidoreductase family protein [Micromonosporaceae bacterium]|nr:NADPH:quinone oxidoreductase family protein [Micromonosporaceae bacterium]